MFKLILQFLNRYKIRRLIANLIVNNLDMDKSQLTTLIETETGAEYIELDEYLNYYSGVSNRIVYDVTILYKKPNNILNLQVFDIFNVQINKLGKKVSFEIESGVRGDGLW